MVVADPKATDQNKGTKPVFRGVNPVAATTAGIFAVFRMGSSISQTQNPAYRRSRPTFCIPKAASWGPQIAVSASRVATARGLTDSVRRCRGNSKLLANLLCTHAR